MKLRPEVVAFAQFMERELRINDHRPGWKGDLSILLARRVVVEAGDLLAATSMYATRPKNAPFSDAAIAAVAKEAADVANMAMMVADVCGALPAVADEADAAGP